MHNATTMSVTEPLSGDRSTAGIREELRELPPSAKLVAKVLEYNGTMTQGRIAEETLLPTRTVRYALNRLEEIDAVQSRFSFSDARKRLYTLEIELQDS